MTILTICRRCQHKRGFGGSFDGCPMESKCWAPSVVKTDHVDGRRYSDTRCSDRNKGNCPDYVQRVGWIARIRRFLHV